MSLRTYTWNNWGILIKKRLHASVFVAIIAIISLWLVSQVVLAEKQLSLFVFPTAVVGEGWVSPRNAGTQELSSEAAFADFSNENSSTITFGVPSLLISTSTEEFPAVATSTIIDPLNAESAVPPASISAPETEQVIEPTPTEIPMESLETPPAFPASSIESETPVVTPLLESWRTIRNMFTSISVIATTTEEGVVAIEEQGTTTATGTPIIINDRSGDQVALCRTLNTECHTLELSGFGIGGSLADRAIDHATLQMSFAARGGSASGNRDRLVIRTWTGLQWELSGEIELGGEISNERHGGYRTFDLPNLRDWADLAQMRVVIEYVRESDADTEVLLDGAWLNVVYQGSGDTIDGALSESYITTNLASVDAEARKARRDTLMTPELGRINFTNVDVRADAKLVVKSDRAVYHALGKTSVYLNVTNEGEATEEAMMQFHFPDTGGGANAVQRWSHDIPFRTSVMQYGSVAYFCEGGWTNATSSSVYVCEGSNEVRSCDSLNDDATNCITADGQLGAIADTTHRDGWKSLPIISGSYADERGIFANLFAALTNELPEGALPNSGRIASHVGESILLQPGQTAYVRVDVDTPLNSKGDFYVEVAGDSGAYGLVRLEWNGSWNYRVPMRVNHESAPRDTTYVIPVLLDDAPREFWSRVATSGLDVRFVDPRTTQELLFSLSGWDKEKEQGTAWVRMPEVESGTSTLIDLYYGDEEGARDNSPIIPLRTEKLTPRYVVAGDGTQRDMTLVLIALDEVRVLVGDREPFAMQAGEQVVVNDVHSQEVVSSSGAITGQLVSVGGRGALVPYAFAHTDFTLPGEAGVEVTLSALEDTEASLDMGTASTSVDVRSDAMVSFPISENHADRLTINHSAVALRTTQTGERIPIYPNTSKDLYGLAGASHFIGASEDNTAFTILCQDGGRREVDGRRAGSVFENDYCAVGDDAGTEAVRLDVKNMVGVAIDGGVARGPIMHLPRSEFASEYILPVDAHSVTLVCAPEDGELSLGMFDGEGVLVASTTCAGRGVYPGKSILTRERDTWGVGYRISSLDEMRKPFLAYATVISGVGEKSVTRVINLWGYPQSRGVSSVDPEMLFDQEEFVIPGEHREIDVREDGIEKEHINKLLVEKREFSSLERPVFRFRYSPQSAGLMQSIRGAFGVAQFTVSKVELIHQSLGVIEAPLNVTYGEDNAWEVSLDTMKGEFRPGKYTLHIEIDEGGETRVDEFDFYWGLLAINYQKSIFTPNENVSIQIGALSNNGNTICDANLRLWITDPSANESEVQVDPSGQCSGNNVVDAPDYAGTFITSATGTYQVRLIRLDALGNLASELSDHFDVVEDVPFVIERVGPTRIYPLAHYEMKVRVRAMKDFSGQIVERIPGDFIIIDRGDADLERVGDDITATWGVTLSAGQMVEHSYVFDAPDKSPFLYLLGPIVMRGTEDVEFTEAREWQIASDAAGKMLIYWDGASSRVPTGWTCLSCSTASTWYRRFAYGSSTYGLTGGTATNTPSATGTVDQLTTGGVGSGGTNNTRNALLTHSHPTFTPTISSASNYPAYYELLLLQSISAGEPTTLPVGTILPFDVASSSLPTSWYRYSEMDGRYPMAASSTMFTGGSNTHSHTVNGSIAAAAETGYREQNTTVNGATDVAHAHTLTATSTDVINNEPPYTEALFARLTATSSPSNYVISMWDDTPPNEWQVISSTSTSLENYFLKASTTYGGIGGVETPSPHRDIVGATTSVADNLNNYTANAANWQAPAAHTHTVTISSFSTETNIPPYVTVVYAKRLSGISVYTQQDFMFYANENTVTLTDPWPLGDSNLTENDPVDSPQYAVNASDPLRIIMNVAVENSTSTVGRDKFKLQYVTSASCATALNWTDVAPIGSSTAIWRGYNNNNVADNTILSGTGFLGSTTVRELYVEQNNSTGTPTELGVGAVGEWDWVVQANSVGAGASYCFRMVLSDGTPLDAYTNYPSVLINASPNIPLLELLYDNEKVGTTSPTFQFNASDQEGDYLDYEIQISTTTTFALTNFTADSSVDPAPFRNVSDTNNQAPFNSGNSISIKITSPLASSTTYWWRVRAKDAFGSNEWGEWSSLRSFTIDTTVRVSTWFQTTKEQFQTDTFDGAESTATDQVMLVTGSTTGWIYGAPINFSDHTTGTVWGNVRFTSTGVIGYQVEYLDATSSWAIVPEADLPGNAAAFTTSPFSLLTIDPTLYPTLRIRATLLNTFGVPRLNDWTLEWGYNVDTPSIHIPFDNQIVASTSPYLEFTTTDPQSDLIVYQVSWSTTPTFTSSSTRTSSVDNGFRNTASTTQNNAFTSGNRIRYVFQPGDALTASTTYFWKVRAMDPYGDASWSFWTDVYSMTPGTWARTGIWYQTVDGQFTTDALTSLETYGSNRLRVATSTREAMIAYAESNTQTPKYRIWNGSSLTGEGDALTVFSQIFWTRLRAAPLSGEYALGTLGIDKDVNVQIYNNGSWDNRKKITSSVSNYNRRGFDIAYEQLSGKLMTVACDGDSDPSFLTWDGTNWSATGTVSISSGANCEWIRLASKPNDNELVLIERNTGSRYEAQVWNATTSSWGNPITLGSMTEFAHEGMAVEYENSGNQAVIVTSNANTNSFQWRAWDGTNWSATTTFAVTDDLEWANMKRGVATDTLALCYTNNANSEMAARWDGTTWLGSQTLSAAGTGNSKNNNRTIDCDYESTTGRTNNIVAIFSTTTQAGFRNYIYTTRAWSAQAKVPTSTTQITTSSVVQTGRTRDGTILALLLSTSTNRYDFTTWASSTWSAFQTIETLSSVTAMPYAEPFSIAAKNPAIEGSIVSTPMYFADGNAPAWKRFYWTDSKSGGSTLTYQLEYLNTGGAWTLVPDPAVLVGNSAGFSSGPVNISSLDPDVYSTLRMKANFTCSTGGVCPYLDDWTLEWAEGINVYGTAKQHNLTSNVTSGTVRVAVNGTLQPGTGTIAANGQWMIPNVTIFPGNIVTVYIDGVLDANEAVAVFKYQSSGDIGGVQLNERWLTVGSASTTGASLSLTNLGQYDYGQSASEDIFFDVTAGGDLNVCAAGAGSCADAGIFVLANNEFRPSPSTAKTITTYDMRVAGTLSGDGNTFKVAGNWRNYNVFNSHTSTVVFNATSSTKYVDQTGAGTSTFYNVTFGEIATSAIWTPWSAFVATGTVQMNYGTTSVATATLTLAGDLTIGINGGFVHGSATTTFNGSVGKTITDNTGSKQNLGTVLIDGSSKTITLGSDIKVNHLTIGSSGILDAHISGNRSITVYGNWRNNNLFYARGGTVTFATTMPGGTIAPGGSAFYNLVFNGSGGSWGWLNTDATTTNMTITAGTVTMATGTMAIGGSFDNAGGTFIAGTSSIMRFTSVSPGNLVRGNGSWFAGLQFAGSGGSWRFLDANATTSATTTILAGTVHLPSGVFATWSDFANVSGSFTQGDGTLKMLATTTGRSVRFGGSLLSNLHIAGTGSYYFPESSATTTADVRITGGTLTFPTNNFGIGGSFINTATFSAGSSMTLFVATSGTKTIDPGGSFFGSVSINGVGSFTISANATATANFRISNATLFTQNSGTTLAVGGTFTNSIGGNATIWTNSILSLYSGSGYSLNSKSSGADAYDTLSIAANTRVSMWNSSSTNYVIDPTGSLYSQNHNAVSGALAIWGAYVRYASTEYWDYATDFDGLSPTGGARQVNVKFAPGASAYFNPGTTLQMIGSPSASTTLDRLSTGNYGVTLSGATLNAQYYQLRNTNTSGLNLTGSTTVLSLDDGDFEVSVASGTAMTVASTTIDTNLALQIFRTKFTTTLSTSTPSDWMEGWSYRKSHVITPATGAGTNYQVKITLHYGAGTDSGSDVYLGNLSRADFGDIRFTRSDGTSTIDYWVASSTNSVIADVWVEVPDDLSSASKTIYLYYGNTSAVYPYLASERAHGDATFLFFDDFSVDLSRWTREVVTGAYPNISSTTTPNFVRNGGGITSGSYGFTSLGSTSTYRGFSNNAIGYKARNATDAIGSVVFRGSATTTNTGYQARFDQRSGQGQSFLRPAYSAWNFLGSCTSDAAPPAVDTWYIYDVTASTSDFKIYRNGTLMKSCSDATHTSPGQISLQNHYGDHTDYDWVFVRKFQGTEPTHSTWGGVESIPSSGGNNVTAVGTSTSFWRFKEHYGGLAGETYDSDPGPNLGNPGYVRWDDSNFAISISGTVYSDAGVTTMGSPTCDGATPVVRVKVNGAGNFAAPCLSSNGTFTVSGVSFSGDTVMTVYLDTVGGSRAVFITKSASANLSNVKLYQNRVIISHEDTSPMSISDMNAYDGGNDSDIPFTATLGSPNTLDVKPDTELWIWTGKTFVPNGNITVNSGGSGQVYDGKFHIDNSAIFTAQGTESHSIGGNWQADSGATFSAASSTFTFTGTTTGKLISAVSSIVFHNLVFNGAGGAWSMSGTETVSNSLAMTAGTLQGTPTLTVNGTNVTGGGTIALTGGTFTLTNGGTFGGSANWTFNNLTLGNGTLATTTKTASSTVTVSGVLTVSANQVFLAGTSTTWVLSGAGTPLVLSGTFNAQNSIFRYAGSGTTVVTPATYWKLDFSANGTSSPTYTLNTGTFVIGDTLNVGNGVNAIIVSGSTYNPTITVASDFTIRSNGTYIASSGTLVLNASYVNTGTFTHSSGKVVFSSSSLGNIVAPGGSSFYDVEFSNASGGWTVGPSMRADRNLSLIAAQNFTVATSTGSALNWYNTNWSQRKSITIDHTKVASSSTTTLTNFPVHIGATNANFKVVASGGNVGKSNGGDILFTASDGTTKLDHELETYVSTTGEMNAWVKVPVLSTSTDTVLYMYYGNASASDQWNITGVWDDGGSNYYKGVWHLKESTGSNPADSSVNANNGTQVNSPSQVAGKIGGSLSLNGTSQNINTSYTQTSVTEYTISTWVKTTEAGTQRAFVQDRGSGAGVSLTLGIGTTGGGHGGAGRIGFEADSNTLDIGVSSVSAINDNTWHHVVGVWSAPSGTAVAISQFKIYIDGALAATTSSATGSATSPLTGLGGTRFGRHEAWSTYFAGTLDEVRIATAVRSADWIRTEYNNQNSPSTFSVFGAEETPGSIVEVRGKFTNSIGGGNTTWTESTLYINSGTAQTLNTKLVGGDVYATLLSGVNTQVSMWNSSAATTTVVGTGSVYSQDHSTNDGELRIWGAYATSGNIYWSYEHDFDGTLLLGANLRPVSVWFAPSASFTLSGGSLEVIGSSTATTTIDRQTTGNYALNISGGSTTMRHMQVRNTDVNGLSFTGTPIINTISDNDFELGVNAGTMIKVSASALDANALGIYYRNRFATSSGISSGYNVTAVGTAASYWRFVGALGIYGNYNGEAYDLDPTGDPGYLIWDDSAYRLVISGTVYSDEGKTIMGAGTCDGVTQNVMLRVQGAGTSTSACGLGTGTFSISNVDYAPGDTITVYLNTGAGGAQAVNVAFDVATNINTMHLYQNRVIVRHEKTDPVTISSMTTYDYDQDADIPFNAVVGSPNTLTLRAGTGLIVWDAKNFTPGGNITLHANASGSSWDGTLHLNPDAIFTGASGQSHGIGGQFIADYGAVFNANSSSVAFTATTTGKRVVASSTQAFGSLTFNGTGGAWNISGVGTTTGDFFITAGAVTFPTTTVSIGGSFDVTSGTFNSNQGTMRMSATTTGKNIRASGSQFNALQFAGTGASWTFLDANATTTGTTTIIAGTVNLPSGTFAVGSDLLNLGGTFTEGNGTLKMFGTTTPVMRFGGSSVGNLLIIGTTTHIFADTNATTTGDVFLTAGTTTFPFANFAIGGSLTNNSAFSAGTSTLLFTATTGAKTIRVGSSSPYHMTIAGTGNFTISTNATTTGNMRINTAGSFTQSPGTTLAVRGEFANLVGGGATTWTNTTLALSSGTTYSINTKSLGGDAYETLRIASSTQVSAWGSSASTVTTDATSAFYSQDNNTNDGELYIYGNYSRSTGADYWSYSKDFDGATLSGIAQRPVSVRFAANATATYTGGSTVNILGGAAATTTIDRQSSGTYGMIIRDGYINAGYHQWRNMEKNGLQLLGTTTISALSFGDFQLDVSNGTNITVASSSVDQNASLQIFNVRFATGTGITAGANVKRVGTSTGSGTAITFQQQSGNIGSEAYDEDGDTVCGSIRFDDSACLFVDQNHYRWRNDDGAEGALSTEWYDQNWTRRQRVRVMNTATATYANVQVRLNVQHDGDMLPDFADLRFTDSSGTTSIPFWKQDYVNSASSTIWVKVPSLPASSYADIFMYYGYSSANDASSGTSTFTFFDDYEDQDITDYTGDNTLFTTSASYNYERSYGLAASNVTAQNTSGIAKVSAGVGNGTRFRYYQYVNTAAPANDNACFMFAVGNPITTHQNYGICFELPGQDKVAISKNVAYDYKNGGATELATTSVTWATGWYQSTVDWLTNGRIDVTVYDSTGAVFATTTYTDTSSPYTTGGVGFTFWGQHGGWDIPSASTYIPVEPTAQFGVEQQDSGATWKASEDTLLNNQLPNENVRLRMTIKNSGTPVSNQNYRLQVAEKGASSNCETVSSGSYTDVTTSGLSAAQMTPSTHFSISSTTQMLSIPSNYSFAYGQIIDDPSTETGNIDVATNQVTEIEYNFQMTSNAIKSAYCFRTVKNGGTPLANYSKIAELRMLHVPSISNMSFNGNAHIALTEGTTTRIYATGTVTDRNGYTDLVAASSTFWRSGLASSSECSADSNNCYQIATTSCSFLVPTCAGDSCDVSCSAFMQYFADPTDAISSFSTENWQARIDVWDNSNSHDVDTFGRELYTMSALSVPATISYGTVIVGGDTGSSNASTSVTNTGNSILNLLLSGNDLKSGASAIPYNYQKYSTSSFTYTGCEPSCVSLAPTTTPVAFGLGVAKPTSTTPVWKDILWGLGVPPGTSATTHSGSNVFTAY